VNKLDDTKERWLDRALIRSVKPVKKQGIINVGLVERRNAQLSSQRMNLEIAWSSIDLLGEASKRMIMESLIER